MPYRFALEDQDYRDFSSGRVLYSMPGMPAFPVRLASDIFQRLMEVWDSRLPGDPKRLIHLYDPCCGGAYHLTVLGFLFWERIGSILASDIDIDSLKLAKRNLELLHPEGLQARKLEIERVHSLYGKQSHAEALESIFHLQHRMETGLTGHSIETRTFLADALSADSIQAGLAAIPKCLNSVDIVFSDVPYGKKSDWLESEAGAVEYPLFRFLSALEQNLNHEIILAIAADKSQKIDHPAYRRLDHFRLGKRQVVILQR